MVFAVPAPALTTNGMPRSDNLFVGSIPAVYDTYLVPLIFAPYAIDLAARVANTGASRVLEIAAGTGVVTRTLAEALPATAMIVATDLNQPMLDHAQRIGTARPVEWRQADALHLPFDDASFDAVVCQFGVMFFPEKRAAFAEVRRVLAPGGTFVFNVWDRIEDNELGEAATAALYTVFLDDAPRFMARVPHGYFDREVITRDLAAAGFTTAPVIDVLAERSRAVSPRIPAIAFCQGTPLRNEIEALDASRLAECTDATEAEIARRFGAGAVDAKMQALVVTTRAV